jgi:murein DD-endopeptidase MepM/ murein hydrolase activator NlpD
VNELDPSAHLPHDEPGPLPAEFGSEHLGAAGLLSDSSVPPGPSTRIVARVVDPAVREDGRGDPVLVLHTADARARMLQSQGPELAARGAAVRERLLAKAHAHATRSSFPPPLSESEPPASLAPGVDAGPRSESEPASLAPRPRSEAPPAPEPAFAALGEAADDLDLIGAPERRRAPQPTTGLPPVTPRTALLLGTAFGVTALAALFALLMHFAPRAPLDLSQRAPLGAAVRANHTGESSAPVAEEATGENAEEAGEGQAAPEVAPPAALRASPAPQPRVRHEPRHPVPAPWRIADTGKDPDLRRVRGSIGQGPFLTSLQSAGVSRSEAYRIYNSFRGVKNLNRCRPQDSFETLLDAKGHVLAFEYSSGESEVFQARESNEGRLTAKQLELRIEKQRAEGVIVVHGGFEASAQRAGFEPGLSEVVNKALAGFTSTGAMKDGDVLALVAQEVTVLGQFDRYAGIEALEYRTRGAQPVRIYYHAVGRARAYVDAKGRTFGKSRWARPVAGAGVSSRFNPRRFHPILKRIKPHNGTDFGAAPGTPILAASSGSVSFVGTAGPNGKMVRLSHGGGYETGYSHLSRFAKGLRAGLRVEQKQVIGYVGSTGRSTGPHLHFSAKRAGRFIDPESLNLDGLQRIPAGDRRTFSVLRQRYDQLLDALTAPGPRLKDVSPALAAAPAADTAAAAAAPSAAAAPAPATRPPEHDSEAPADDPAPQDDAEE